MLLLLQSGLILWLIPRVSLTLFACPGLGAYWPFRPLLLKGLAVISNLSPLISKLSSLNSLTQRRQETRR